jgi:hypothetical protein
MLLKRMYVFENRDWYFMFYVLQYAGRKSRTYRYVRTSHQYRSSKTSSRTCLINEWILLKSELCIIYNSDISFYFFDFFTELRTFFGVTLALTGVLAGVLLSTPFLFVFFVEIGTSVSSSISAETFLFFLSDIAGVEL